MAIQGAEQRQAISAAVDWSLPAFGDRHLSKFGVDTAHVLCHSIDMRRASRKRRTCAPSRASSLSDRERLFGLVDGRVPGIARKLKFPATYRKAGTRPMPVRRARKRNRLRARTPQRQAADDRPEAAQQALLQDDAFTPAGVFVSSFGLTCRSTIRRLRAGPKQHCAARIRARPR